MTRDLSMLLNLYSCHRRARIAPPSITNVPPVMKLDSSDARKRASQATSSGVPESTKRMPFDILRASFNRILGSFERRCQHRRVD